MNATATGYSLLACMGICLVACSSNTKRASTQLSSVAQEPGCIEQCGEARAACRSECTSMECNADCESAWELCRPTCGDASVVTNRPPHTSSIGVGRVSGGGPVPSNTGQIGGSLLADAGTPAVDSGLNGISITGSGGLNGISITGSGGLNGISITGSAGLNGINVTAVGGASGGGP
jgi:hypothetical protein